MGERHTANDKNTRLYLEGRSGDKQHQARPERSLNFQLISIPLASLGLHGQANLSLYSDARSIRNQIPKDEPMEIQAATRAANKSDRPNCFSACELPPNVVIITSPLDNAQDAWRKEDRRNKGSHDKQISQKWRFSSQTS